MGGMDQIINDDLSGMPIWLGCFIIYLITVPLLFTVQKWVFPTMVIVTAGADDATALMWMWSFIFGLCAMFIPMSILGVIPSMVQSLYVLWGDDPAAFDQTRPEESAALKKAAWECLGYKVVYDDARILQ